jgi:ASC-1-like (ASCH) protein
METLKIIIKGEYFDMIKSGEKKIEYREVTPFWTSRLYDKEGKKRAYDKVLFINGYNKDARRMETEFKGVNIKDGVYNIHLGKILK